MTVTAKDATSRNRISAVLASCRDVISRLFRSIRINHRLALPLAAFLLCLGPVAGEKPGSAQAGQGGDPAVALETRTLGIVTADGRERRFTVEIADTPATRARGLMFRRSLAPDSGMLLVYPKPGPVSIWMKNTYLSLDILYIDGQGRISQIVERAVPLSETSMPSDRPVKGVLELSAGSAAHFGLKPGDRVLLLD